VLQLYLCDSWHLFQYNKICFYWKLNLIVYDTPTHKISSFHLRAVAGSTTASPITTRYNKVSIPISRAHTYIYSWSERWLVTNECNCRVILFGEQRHGEFPESGGVQTESQGSFHRNVGEMEIRSVVGQEP